MTEKFQNPLDRIPKDQRHPFERRVLAAKEMIDHRKDLAEKFMLAPNGRAPFEIPLNAEEKRQRQLGGATSMQQRVQDMNAQIKENGPAGARDYLDELRRLARSGEEG